LCIFLNSVFVLGCKCGKFFTGVFWILEIFGGYLARTSPARMQTRIDRDIPSGGEGEGDPQRKLTIPQTLARNWTTARASLGNAEGFRRGVREHTLDALAVLPNGGTVVATDVLAECDGNVERLHGFSGGLCWVGCANLRATQPRG